MLDKGYCFPMSNLAQMYKTEYPGSVYEVKSICHSISFTFVIGSILCSLFGVFKNITPFLFGLCVLTPYPHI